MACVDLPTQKKRSVVKCPVVAHHSADRLRVTGKKHTEKTLAGLNALRQQHQFCDFVIKIGNELIPCHRGILAVSSDYFHAMFTVGMAESTGGELSLDHLDAECVRIIIDYMYTGKLDVDQDKVQDLLMIADMLQMNELKQAFAQHLEKKIDFVNCLGLYQFGEQFLCEDVMSKCEQMIKQRFVMLLGTQDMQDLPLDILTRIIAWQDLSLEPQGEVNVLRCVCDWVTRDAADRGQHFPALLKHIHTSQLSESNIISAKQHPSLQQNTDLLEAFEMRLSESDSGRRQSTLALYIVGGYLQSRTGPACPRLKSALRLHPRSMQWQAIAELPLAGSGVVTFAVHRRIVSFLYEWSVKEMVGNVEQYRAVMEYDPVQNAWINITHAFCVESMDLTYQCLTVGGSTAFCATSNRLFVMSRQHVHVFRIDRDEDGDVCVTSASHQTYETPPEIQMMKFADFGLVAYDGRLWCIGGNDVKAKYEIEAVAGVWAMDVEDGTWEQKQSMGEKRARMAVLERDGLIYAFGGYNGARLATCEVYDPVKNAWFPIASMAKHRTHFSACELGGKIYVMGGKSYSFNSQASGGGVRKVLKFTEIYDPDTDTWSPGPEMPQARCMYGAAIL